MNKTVGFYPKDLPYFRAFKYLFILIPEIPLAIRSFDSDRSVLML